MSFPFDPSQGPIFVRGEVSGPLGAANLQLLLDTGATTSLIRATILTTLGYDPDASTDRVQVTMGGGATIAPRVVVTRLMALGQHRIGFPVLSLALPPDAGVDGLLGLDFFRGQLLTLDFRGGVITLT
jgi:predicted aspartyl protease